MPTFSYVAVDSRGRTIPGELEADDRRSVRSYLRGKGLTPVDVKTKGNIAGGTKAKAKPRKATNVRSQGDTNEHGAPQKSFSLGGSRKSWALSL